MSTHYSKPVPYHCMNDCEQAGCPGHVLRFVFDGTSDTYSYEVDGKLRAAFDEHEFRALQDAFGDQPRQVTEERLKHLEYRNDVLKSAWCIIAEGIKASDPDADPEYDTNNFYDRIREGVAAKKELADMRKPRFAAPVICPHGKVEVFCRECDLQARAQLHDAVALGVLGERERLATVAEASAAEAEAILAKVRADETWQFAINEMSGDVNREFCRALEMLAGVAAKIRSGK